MGAGRICWVCREAPADSGEHKYPAAWLRRIEDDWSEMYHGSADGRRFHTQGPGSQNFKLPVLCRACNNARTAGVDRALDAFLRFADEHEDRIWSERRVDLHHALGRHDVLDLYRALLKLEFSRHAEYEVPIHPAIADFVGGGDDWETAQRLVRVGFRAVENMQDWRVRYPSESDLRHLGPFHFQQLHFGWLGVHFMSVSEARHAPAWGTWDLGVAALAPSHFSLDGSIDPWT